MTRLFGFLRALSFRVPTYRQACLKRSSTSLMIAITLQRYFFFQMTKFEGDSFITMTKKGGGVLASFIK